MDAPSSDRSYDRAVASARGAFDEGRTRDPAWRAAQLAGLIRLIDRHEADIARALDRDPGKPRAEARDTAWAFRRWVPRGRRRKPPGGPVPIRPGRPGGTSGAPA